MSARSNGIGTPSETSRQRWVRETRESVLRALRSEGVPQSAQSLEGNLDVSSYLPSFGFVGRRSVREIGAALRWHFERGNVEPVHERDPYDPPGKLFALTKRGVDAVVPKGV